jgi:hypothetical protein
MLGRKKSEVRVLSKALRSFGDAGSVLGILLILCLLLPLFPAPICSAEQSVNDSFSDAVWNNAWTETYYGNGTQPFKTVIHSRPQRVWNGTAWKEYEISSVNGTAATLQTPTCAYSVTPLKILLYHPCTGACVGSMEWVVEEYSEGLGSWFEESVAASEIAYNASHVWQKLVFADGSVRTLYIDSNNKQTVELVSASQATFRLSWRFTGIAASKATLSNGVLLELARGRVDSFPRFNFSALALWNGENPVLLLEYGDIDDAFYRECAVGSTDDGLAGVSLTYGDWSLRAGEGMVLDPTTETFFSEAALDGKITMYGFSYPPSDFSVDTQGNIVVGQEYSGDYLIYRGYASFDTSGIPDYANVTGATLKLKTCGNSSVVDFTMRVMGGSQPIYGDSLSAGDWGCGSVEAATWPSSSYPGANTYVNVSIPVGQVNKTGRTQFELESDREGYPPQMGSPEYVSFYSADSAGDEPMLEVTWLPYTVYEGGQWWYYWNSTNSRKLAIVLFGGRLSGSGVRINPLFDDDEWTWDLEYFVLQLCQNGFDVINNMNRTDYNTTYNAWIYDAAVSMADRYDYIHLFGFSAGGATVAYEIQKANASIYSSAMVSSAPVDWGYGIFNTAATANETRVCVSFIAPKDDYYYFHMAKYFNNTDVHKDWHRWNSTHAPFDQQCLTHPSENVSQAAISWFDKHSVVLKNPSYEDRLRAVYGSAHWETNNQGRRDVRGDTNCDGTCNGADLNMLLAAYGSRVNLNKTYDWRCDLNGDGIVNANDLNTLLADYGKSATRLNGSYSWFTNGGGDYSAWQWLNASIRLIEGKQLNFSLSFLASNIYVNGTETQARAEICYVNSTGEHWLNGSWFHPTSNTTWYTLSVAADIPEDATAVKVVIHGRPDFKAWIDLASLNIEDS